MHFRVYKSWSTLSVQQRIIEAWQDETTPGNRRSPTSGIQPTTFCSRPRCRLTLQVEDPPPGAPEAAMEAFAQLAAQALGQHAGLPEHQRQAYATWPKSRA